MLPLAGFAVLAVVLAIWLLSRATESRTRSRTLPLPPESYASIAHVSTPLSDHSSPSPPQELRNFKLQVHGIYHRNSDGSSRQAAIRSCRVGELLDFVPEPDNPHDPFAIKVCRENGQQLGYLSAGDAMRIGGDMSIGWTYRVTVDEIFLTDRAGYYGCRIHIGVLTMSRRTEARRH
jgi:hypothetical protein